MPVMVRFTDASRRAPERVDGPYDSVRMEFDTLLCLAGGQVVATYPFIEGPMPAGDECGWAVGDDCQCYSDVEIFAAA